MLSGIKNYYEILEETIFLGIDYLITIVVRKLVLKTLIDELTRINNKDMLSSIVVDCI